MNPIDKLLVDDYRSESEKKGYEDIPFLTDEEVTMMNPVGEDRAFLEKINFYDSYKDDFFEEYAESYLDLMKMKNELESAIEAYEMVKNDHWFVRKDASDDVHYCERKVWEAEQKLKRVIENSERGRNGRK